MSIEDVVLVATVREDIRNDGSKTEIPLRIEATQAKISQTVGDVIGPTSMKSVVVPNEPVLAEAVNASPGVEGDSDNGSKTVATSPDEDKSDKRGSDEHLVSFSGVLASSEMQRIDGTQPPKAGTSVVSLGENNKQEVEQQVQEAASEDRVEHPSARESKDSDGTSEKESKNTEEETHETGADLGADADKVKAEPAPSDAPRIANTITEEPEAQEEKTKKPERIEEASPSPATSRTSLIAQEPQPPARATTPLYWRRLTARYMSVGPQPS